MEFTGKLITADIGFPSNLTNSEDLKIELIDCQYIQNNFITELKPDTHKAERGHMLLVGGFDCMEGAIMLTARASLETGTGLITLLTTEKARQIIAGKIPEMMTSEISLNKEKLDEFFSDPKYRVMVIGPGMGRDSRAKAVFSNIIENIYHYGIKRVLIDGDGLFHLAEYLQSKKLDNRTEFIITPHFMEASRLLNRSVDDIKKNRLESAKILSRETTAVTLLKGPASIVSDSINSFINTTGNPALATAGSGDVLSGIIGSLMLHDIPMTTTASIGAYIHGKSADMFCSKNKVNSMKSGDIIEYIKNAVKNCWKD